MTSVDPESNLKTARKSAQVNRILSKPMGSVESYMLNRQMVLAAQRFGGGADDVNEIFGQLGVGRNCFWGWTELEEQVAKTEIALTKEIITENLKAEADLSAKDANGLAKLEATMDMGWSKRGNGRRYVFFQSSSTPALFSGTPAMEIECSSCHH